MHSSLSTLFRSTALAAVFAAALPAQALTLVSTSSNGHLATADVVQAGALPTIAADITFTGFGAVSFVFELDAADVDGLAGFNAVITNQTGADITGLQLAVDRGTFELTGSVTPSFGTVALLSGDARQQRITFMPGEPFGVDLGNPFGAAGAQDGLIGFAGLAAGDRFSLTVSAVPEPGTWALLLAGGGLMLSVRRRGPQGLLPPRRPAPTRRV